MITRRTATDEGFCSHGFHRFNIMFHQFIDHLLLSHSDERPTTTPFLWAKKPEVHLCFFKKIEHRLGNGVGGWEEGGDTPHKIDNLGVRFLATMSEDFM